MQARHLSAGDVLKDGSRFVVVGKVEITKGRVVVNGHDSNTGKKCVVIHSPDAEVEVN
jgi:hypothetical protein